MIDSDKRKVSTDALETLGNIIDENEKRDAIHLAVEPTLATVKVFPGQDVNAEGIPKEPFAGIVDPFLKTPVLPGERFWLVVYPRQIHSLRHVWTHPSFTDESFESVDDLKKKSKEWISSYAESVGNGYSYEEMMAYADDYIRKNGWAESLIGAEEMQGECTSKEFWEHYEIVRDIKLSEEEKNYNFFGCSC